MTLNDYLDSRGLTQLEICKRSTLSPGTVSLLLRGLIGASGETLNKISVATMGRVKCRQADWPELDFKMAIYPAKNGSDNN